MFVKGGGKAVGWSEVSAMKPPGPQHFRIFSFDEEDTKKKKRFYLETGYPWISQFKANCSGQMIMNQKILIEHEYINPVIV